MKIMWLSSVMLALLAACGGGPSARSDEDQILELVGGAARAYAIEDWSAFYELYAPSVREGCRKSEFLASTNVAVESTKGFIGEEAWDAFREEASDGYDVESIEINGDKAKVVVREQDDPLDFVREDGRWWAEDEDEDPCELSFAAETPQPKETLEPTDAPVPGGSYAIGERVAVEGFPDIVVMEFSRTTDPGDVLEELFAEGESLEAGNEYLVITIQVINDTDKPAGVGDFTDLTLISRGEEITEALSYVSGVEGALQAETLPAGADVTGRVAWSARYGFDELQLLYTPEFGGGSFIVDLE